MRIRQALAAVAIAAMVVMDGCSGGKPAVAPTTSHPAATPPASVGPPAIGPSTSAGPATSAAATATSAPPSSAAGNTHCTTGSLSLTLGDLGAAAGTAYRELIFTNTSARPCTMLGYAGVSFLDSHGAPIGAPVPRMSRPVGLVVLPPGGAAAALLSYNDAYVATSPDCRPMAAAAIRAYPPDQAAALTVATNLMVCANKSATGTALIGPVSSPAGLHP